MIKFSALTIMYGGADCVITEFHCDQGSPEGEGGGSEIVNPISRETLRLVCLPLYHNLTFQPRNGKNFRLPLRESL